MTAELPLAVQGPTKLWHRVRLICPVMVVQLVGRNSATFLGPSGHEMMQVELELTSTYSTLAVLKIVPETVVKLYTRLPSIWCTVVGIVRTRNLVC
jgi:hypothetical protein